MRESVYVLVFVGDILSSGVLDFGFQNPRHTVPHCTTLHHTTSQHAAPHRTAPSHRTLTKVDAHEVDPAPPRR